MVYTWSPEKGVRGKSVKTYFVFVETNTYPPRFAETSVGNTFGGNTILTDASGVVAALLRLAPAGTALRPAPLRAALGRTLGLPLAALLRGRLPARGTSLRRHGSNDSELRVQHNCFELGNRGGAIAIKRLFLKM